MNSTTEIAKIAHEANKAYCESLGDFSHDPWFAAQQWQRDSVINGVLSIERNEVKAPGESHENWLRIKEKEGWVYGTEKNSGTGTRTHPCMLPFNDLPHAQQIKDHLFFAIVTTLLEK